MLITVFGYWFQPEGHWEPHNEVGSQNLAKHLVGFECKALTHYKAYIVNVKP